MEKFFEVVDGTRIKAVNNKDRNFTTGSLQKFIEVADKKLEDYLRPDILDRRRDHRGAPLQLHQTIDEPGRLSDARVGECPRRVQSYGARLQSAPGADYSRRRGHGEGGRGLKVAKPALIGR